MNDSLVSVVIPTFNGADKLARAIDSVLTQTYQNVEIIIVDDNPPSSDSRKETINVINQYQPNQKIIYLKHHENLNGAVARNTGIKVAQGKYICFLDDDDFYLPQRIEKSVAKLEADGDYDAVYCQVLLSEGKRISGLITASKSFLQKDLLLDEMIFGTGSNLFMTKKAILNLGGFDGNFIRHQDFEMMLRFLERYKIINLEEILVVKNSNRQNNKPSYLKYRNAKQMLFEKFGTIITGLNESERQRFYEYQYEVLLNAAFGSRNLTYIKKAIGELVRYRRLTHKEKMNYFLVLCKVYQSPLYNLVVYLRNKLIAYFKMDTIRVDVSLKRYIKELILRYNS